MQLHEENEVKELNEYYDAAVLFGTDLTRDVGNWIWSTAVNVETRLLRSQEDLHPEDSISNASSLASSKSSRHLRKGLSIVFHASSRTSSISAAKTKAAAKGAVLQAEAASLERFHAFQKEELSIQQRRRALELETEIAKAQPEEVVYVEAEADHVATPRSLVPAANQPTSSQSAVNDCSSDS